MTNFERHEEGGLCVCMHECVFIWDRESDRLRKQQEARRRCLRPVWSLWSETRREGRGGRSHYHLGFASARRPSAHNSPPAPHFLTLLINRSLVWLVTIESSRGAGGCEEVDDLLVSSTDLTSIFLCLRLWTHTDMHMYKKRKGVEWVCVWDTLILFWLCCNLW